MRLSRNILTIKWEDIMTNEIIMEFGFVKFNHETWIDSVWTDKPHSVEIFYKNGAKKTYQYFFSAQVLFRLIVENFKYVFCAEPLP